MTEQATAYVPMTREELAAHHIGRSGRDYALSCDGYGDMDVAEAGGWRVLANWGRDGWNLGSWPYVAVYVRESNDGRTGEDGTLIRVWEMMQIVEGDRDVYEFAAEQARERAIDYLFLWYAAGQDWAPLSYQDRDRLDLGLLIVDARWRGPCQV